MSEDDSAMSGARNPTATADDDNMNELTSSSSSDSDEDEDEERPQQQQRPSTGESTVTNLRSRGSSALRSILSILVGRGDLGGLGSADTDSEESAEGDENDPSFWPPLRRPQPPRPVKPGKELLQNLKKSDYAYLTRKDLHLLKREEDAPPAKINRMVANRQAGNFGRSSRNFSHPHKCAIYSKILPNRKTEIARHSSKLFCGSYSTNGDIFMSACQDSMIRLYDTSNGQFRPMKGVHARNVGWSVLDVALSPDSRHLIYTSWCDYIHQVNVFGDEERHDALPLSADDSRFCIFSVRFSNDGNEILGGANDGFIYLFDRESQQQSLRIHAHRDDVNAVSFVDDRTHILASGGDDGLCKVWDRRALRESDPRPVGVLAGHVDGITYIDPRGDGRHLITNCKDQSIKLWDIRKFSSQPDLEAMSTAVQRQNWDYRWQSVPRHLDASGGRPKGKKGSSSSSSSGQKANSRHDASVMTYRGHTVLQTLIRCHFSPAHTTGQRFIYTGCASGSVIIYDSLTGEVVRRLQGHKSCVRDVSWHPYQPEILSSSWDYTLNRWEYSEPSLEEEKTMAEEENKKGKDDDGWGRKRKRAFLSGLISEDDLLQF